MEDLKMNDCKKMIVTLEQLDIVEKIYAKANFAYQSGFISGLEKAKFLSVVIGDTELSLCADKETYDLLSCDEITFDEYVRLEGKFKGMSNKLSENYIREKLKEVFANNPNITLENAIKEVYVDDKEICDAVLNAMNKYNKNI